MSTAPATRKLLHQSLVGTLWRHARLNLLVCVGVAFFLTQVLKDGFWRNLVYSLCIGLSIQALIEGGRLGISQWLKRRGRSGPELDEGWPGWAAMAPWVLFSAVSGYVIGMTLGGWLTGQPVDPKMSLSNPRALFIVLSVTLAVSVVFTYLFYTSGQLMAAQAQAQAAARLASEHELRLLQSQLEPHMLFNTLANLRVLIGLDPQRAQTMLDHMIGFLRATLNASRTRHHPLAAEFDRLADYLALMAIRMGPRLQVSLDLPEALRAVPVPPLLVQPLVENSIQHGLEPKVQGGRIAVSARREGAQLVITVRDTGIGLADAAAGPAPVAPGAPGSVPGIGRGSAAGTGFGTTQVRDRLRTLFGEAGRLSLAPASDGEGGTIATLTLPWTEPDAQGAPPWAASLDEIEPCPQPDPAPRGFAFSRGLAQLLLKRSR